MCHAQTTESCANRESKGDSVGKLPLYEILYTLNQGFEQVLAQLRLLEKLGLGHQWKALRVSVEENRAEVNFELVEQVAEREEGLDLHFVTDNSISSVSHSRCGITESHGIGRRTESRNRAAAC
jgi:hypothetical protein